MVLGVALAVVSFLLAGTRQEMTFLSETSPSSSTSSVDASVANERSVAFAAKMPDLLPNRRRIYLLRHGQTEWNERGLMQGGGHDIPLNRHGLKQAKCASDALSCVSMDVVASSHLARAIETADAIRMRHPSSVGMVLPDLGEMRFGDFEGLAIHGPEATEDTKERFCRFNERVAQDIHLKWPGEGGESTHQVGVRAQRAVEEILAQHPEARHLAVIAHGRLNKVLLALLILGDSSKFSPIKQGNTCINVIDFNENTDNFESVVINYVDHTEVDERHLN